MNKKIVKFMPIVIPTVSLLIWLVAFLLDQFTTIHKGWVWLPWVGIQIVISTICGIVIKNLTYGANNDGLTGLYNRGYFNRRLAEEMSRLKRTHSSLSLILMDIDNFKWVNDSYGHLKGDEVLTQLGVILKRYTRALDITARWGGEEFAIILPETDLDGAKIFAERLRKSVEEFDFEFQLTISIGAVSTHGDISLDELLSQADEALYLAKEGKNRVVTYPIKKTTIPP